VGQKAAKTLERWGITTIGGLARCPDEILIRNFGITGLRMKQYANGEDRSRVTDAEYEPPVKSLGHGMTFLRDLTGEEEVWPMILALSDTVACRLRESGKKAKGVSLSVKCCDLSAKEWQGCLEHPSQNALDLARRAFALFQRNYPWVKPIRALCVRAIRLDGEEECEQLSILSPAQKRQRTETVDRTVDEIRRRFGSCSIGAAATLHLEKMPHPEEDADTAGI